MEKGIPEMHRVLLAPLTNNHPDEIFSCTVANARDCDDFKLGNREAARRLSTAKKRIQSGQQTEMPPPTNEYRH